MTFETRAKRLGNVLIQNPRTACEKIKRTRNKISILTGDFYRGGLLFTVFLLFLRCIPPGKTAGCYRRIFPLLYETSNRATTYRPSLSLSKLRISRTKTDFLRRLKISFVIPETPPRIVHSARHFFVNNVKHPGTTMSMQMYIHEIRLYSAAQAILHLFVLIVSNDQH